MHQIDPNRIGLLGISQAGWINPLAASLSDEIAFYINISGPAVSVGEEGRFSSFTNNGNSASLTDIASYNESMLSVSPSGFNPLPILADLHSPALWIFGRDDLSVPTAKSVLNLEKLRAAGRDNITVVVYADTGHSLRINPGGLVRGNFDSPSFVSGYFPQQLAWLVEQGFLTSN